MADHTLNLRATVIAGDRLDDDYCVYFDGRNVGRIMLAEDHVKHVEEWRWSINLPLPMPGWANGSAASLEAAKAQFKAAWERFYARLSPERIEHWHQVADAGKRDS